MSAAAVDLDALRAHAVVLKGEADRVLVPEPVVKDALRHLGVTVPRGAVAADAAEAAVAAKRLDGAVVLKAFGPGIVHKSDFGAVRVGLAAGDVEDAAIAMAARLAEHGITPAGFLVEEQQSPGVELIIGVVRHDSFGPVVLLGVGGTLTELVDRNVMGVYPLDEASARVMLADFPTPALLDGARAADPVDRDVLVSLLLSLAGPGGLVEQLGDALVEFECNPVIASSDAAVAVDARLVLAARDAAMERAPAPATDFTALFAPRAIAVAGASTSRETFGNRFLAAYRDAGWTDSLFAIHPDAREIDGVPAYPSVGAVPGGVDYLLVAVPAARTPDLVAHAAGSTRFVHVISGGFGETGADGVALEKQLRTAARGADIRVLGPNCMGVFSPAGRQTFQLDAPREPGVVSVVSQSGGLAGDIVKAGDRRGIRFSKLVTVGNAIDVQPGELLEWLVDDPDTAVLGLYLEAALDGRRLVGALRRAAGRKPVVLLVGGSSRQGARAVASHTGALAADARIWNAIAKATGASIVTTLEDFLAVLAFHQRYATNAAEVDASVMIVGPGGGASVLATDACDRAGLTVTAVEGDVVAQLCQLGYGAGTSVANPIEIPLGPAVGPDSFNRVLDAVFADQHYRDAMLHVNVQAYHSYGTKGVAPLLELLAHLGASDWPGTRVALVLRSLECASPADARALADACTAAELVCFRDFDEAATAVAAAQRFDRARRR
jgi:acyl-CoA synthetase (NDP forming)